MIVVGCGNLAGKELRKQKFHQFQIGVQIAFASFEMEVRNLDICKT